MANEFISVKEVARGILPALVENLVFPNLVHKDYSEEFAAGKGDTIQVKKPVVLKASEFDEATGTSDQDIKETSVGVKLDHLATVDVSLSAIQSATNISSIQDQIITPAAIALAQKINADGLGLYADIPYFTGTAGTTPSTISAFTGARKVLNDNKVPTAGRVAVWDAAADAKFLEIPAVLNAEKSGSTAALRDGSIGKLIGFDNYMSQAVKGHTCGTAQTKTLLVDGAVTAGATAIHIDGGTGTETVLKGDLFVIAGVQFVCTEDVTFASGEGTVKVYPAAPKNIADNTAVTMVGSHTANLAFAPQAFAFVTRPLVAPSGVEAYTTSYNGVTLRVVKGYDMTHKRERMSVDVLYGYKTMYQELATRVLG